MTDTHLIDVGAQAERTALAWQRTGISALLVAALLMHARVNGQLWSGLMLAATAAVAVLVLVPWRYRCVLRAVRAERTPLSRTAVQGIAVFSAVVIVSVAAQLLTH